MRFEVVSIELSKGENYQDEELGKQLVLEYKQLEEDIQRLYSRWEDQHQLLED